LKILHINNSDSSGGASRACTDINNALVQAGVESSVLVQTKRSNLKGINSINTNFLEKSKSFIRKAVDYTTIKFFSVEYRGRFTFPYIGKDISKLEIVRNSDIINLHWINEGFFSFNTLNQLAKLKKPIVWTLHDMWSFTGGCHYSLGCEKFKRECYECPSLKFKGMNDFSKKIFNKKLKIYQDLNINIITCSKWLSEQTRLSRVFQNRRIEVIPNTLKTDIYKPLDRFLVFNDLELDKDKKYILFGTMTLKDKRKGLDLFIESINLLVKKDPSILNKIELLIMGSGKKMSKFNLPLKIRFLGRLGNEKQLAKFYNAGVLFVAPSREDNLPNTVMESLSCGTPVVAFNIGGIPDMIDHKINGYLAQPFNAEELADGILWVLNQQAPEQLKSYARNKIIQNFSYEKIALSYSEYYKSIL